MKIKFLFFFFSFFLFSCGTIKTEYFDTGEIKNRGRIIKNDLKHGVWKNYSKSGRQSGKTKWKRGVRHGWSEFKSFDGYIWTKTKYVNGKTSIWKIYGINGNLLSKKKHKNGVVTFIKCWDEFGKQIECVCVDPISLEIIECDYCVDNSGNIINCD